MLTNLSGTAVKKILCYNTTGLWLRGHHLVTSWEGEARESAVFRPKEYILLNLMPCVVFDRHCDFSVFI